MYLIIVLIGIHSKSSHVSAGVNYIIIGSGWKTITLLCTCIRFNGICIPINMNCEVCHRTYCHYKRLNGLPALSIGMQKQTSELCWKPIKKISFSFCLTTCTNDFFHCCSDTNIVWKVSCGNYLIVFSRSKGNILSLCFKFSGLEVETVQVTSEVRCSDLIMATTLSQNDFENSKKQLVMWLMLSLILDHTHNGNATVHDVRSPWAVFYTKRHRK